MANNECASFAPLKINHNKQSLQLRLHLNRQSCTVHRRMHSLWIDRHMVSSNEYGIIAGAYAFNLLYRMCIILCLNYIHPLKWVLITGLLVY